MIDARFWFTTAVVAILMLEVAFLFFILLPIAISVMVLTGHNIFRVVGPCKP